MFFLTLTVCLVFHVFSASKWQVCRAKREIIISLYPQRYLPSRKHCRSLLRVSHRNIYSTILSRVAISMSSFKTRQMVRIRYYYRILNRENYGSEKKLKEMARHNIQQLLLFIGYRLLVANSDNIKCSLPHFIIPPAKVTDSYSHLV